MELNKYFDAEFTKLLAKYNGFFAFGNKQFEESKKEGMRYISLDGGLLLGREVNSTMTGQEYADMYYSELDIICKESARLDLEQYGLEKIIKYELNNHECSYTGNIDSALNALEKYGATKEQVMLVFRGKSL